MAQNNTMHPLASIRQLSSLYRPIDIHTPSNVVAVAAAILTVAIVALIGVGDGDATATVLVEGVFAGATVFIAWVIARELDPDYQRSGLIALPVALVIYLLIGESALFSVATLIIGARFLDRTVGPMPKPSDGVVLAGVVALAILFHGQWFLGMVVFVALLFENMLPNTDPKWYLYAGGVALATLGATFLSSNLGLRWQFDGVAFGVALVTSAAFLVKLLRQPRYLQSRCDDGSMYLRWERVAAAQVFVLMAALASLLFQGADGIAAMGSAWAAMGAVGAYAIYQRVTRQPIPESPVVYTSGRAIIR